MCPVSPTQGERFVAGKYNFNITFKPINANKAGRHQEKKKDDETPVQSSHTICFRNMKTVCAYFSC